MSDRMPFRDLRATHGTSSSIEWDDAAKTFSIVTEFQDVQPLLDQNTAKRNAGRAYYARDPDMWRVASIPIGVQYEWMTKFGVDLYKEEHMPKVVKLLNSPDYRYLKTADIIV
jgi:hypothetical protein